MQRYKLHASAVHSSENLQKSHWWAPPQRIISDSVERIILLHWRDIPSAILEHYLHIYTATEKGIISLTPHTGSSHTNNGLVSPEIGLTLIERILLKEFNQDEKERAVVHYLALLEKMTTLCVENNFRFFPRMYPAFCYGENCEAYLMPPYLENWNSEQEYLCAGIGPLLEVVALAGKIEDQPQSLLLRSIMNFLDKKDLTHKPLTEIFADYMHVKKERWDILDQAPASITSYSLSLYEILISTVEKVHNEDTA